MIKKTIVAAAALLAAVAGCKKEEPVATDCNSIEFKSLTGQKIYILEDTAREFKSDSDIAFRDSATVLIPTVLFGHDVKPLNERIMHLAFDTLCATPAAAMDAYFASVAGELGYNVAEADSTVMADDIDGFCTVQGDIYNLTDSRLTYRVAQSIYYPGAAHGMYNIYYITCDLKNGEILDLEDLFTPEGLDRLPSVISRRARKMEAQLGPTNITGLPEGGNFYVSLDDEIVFVYQPYEVASYAQGVICVPFYPYELSEFLTPVALRFFSLDQ